MSLVYHSKVKHRKSSHDRSGAISAGVLKARRERMDQHGPLIPYAPCLYNRRDTEAGTEGAEPAKTLSVSEKRRQEHDGEGGHYSDTTATQGTPRMTRSPRAPGECLALITR